MEASLVSLTKISNLYLLDRVMVCYLVRQEERLLKSAHATISLTVMPFLISLPCAASLQLRELITCMEWPNVQYFGKKLFCYEATTYLHQINNNREAIEQLLSASRPQRTNRHDKFG